MQSTLLSLDVMNSIYKGSSMLFSNLSDVSCYSAVFIWCLLCTTLVFTQAGVSCMSNWLPWITFHLSCLTRHIRRNALLFDVDYAFGRSRILSSSSAWLCATTPSNSHVAYLILLCVFSHLFVFFDSVHVVSPKNEGIRKEKLGRSYIPLRNPIHSLNHLKHILPSLFIVLLSSPILYAFFFQ